MIQRDQNRRPTRFISRSVCFTEGETDGSVVESLIRHLQIQEEWDFFSLQNKDAWPTKLQAISNTPGFGQVKAILLVRDADDNPGSAANAISQCCASMHWPDPTKSGESMARSADLAIGYYLWKGADGVGELEDQCLAAVSSNGRLPCLDSYFDCLRSNTGPKQSKRRLQAYLAGLPEYCPGIKTAAQTGALQFSAPTWESLASLATELSRKR